ncbi:PLDc N-terminal domain-containing protein [Dyadobacter subterraneus]|uniref:PLDc N-terminal domain-containing protein n=1 Tax=Dyadobacter subterraneus TaxID=2773304 RepID=A0ABR9WDJ1_9BACT|nr:PLDc N-terminal domain-containing protein [Dyadobacter subterraneus]
MGTYELALIFLAILVYLQIIVTIISLLRNNDLETFEKVVWLLLILLVPVIGTLIYLFFGMPRKVSNTK